MIIIRDKSLEKRDKGDCFSFCFMDCSAFDCLRFADLLLVISLWLVITSLTQIYKEAQTKLSFLFSLFSYLSPLYPNICFKSCSGVVVGAILNFSTSTLRTVGDTKAGSDGPSLIFFIPK